MARNGDQQLDELIRRSRSGDTAAFGELVRRYETPIRAWVAAHCPPGGDADEVAQRTFLAAYERLEKFEPGTNFSAWLFSIARYQLMTETTRLRRLADYTSRYASSLMNGELQRRAEQPGEAFSGRLGHLRACLDEISENCRRLVRWRYEEEIALQEMAERTGRSVTAIAKQLWVIRQKLRECVERRLAEDAGGTT